MNPNAIWTDPPHTHHATVRDAAGCPQCRAWHIDFLLKDAPHAYLLTFPPADGGPHALSLIRDWSPDCSDAATTAWATGCNLLRCVLIEEIPVRVAVESGVEMFRIHEGGAADEALRVIRSLRGWERGDDA